MFKTLIGFISLILQKHLINVISTYVEEHWFVDMGPAILLRRWMEVAMWQVQSNRARYQIGYLQTNQDRDIMARFQLGSGRVKGFICRKHMAATQNPIQQMPELLWKRQRKYQIQRRIVINQTIQQGSCFTGSPNPPTPCAQANLIQFLVLYFRQLMSRRKT